MLDKIKKQVWMRAEGPHTFLDQLKELRTAIQ